MVSMILLSLLPRISQGQEISAFQSQHSSFVGSINSIPLESTIPQFSSSSPEEQFASEGGLDAAVQAKSQSPDSAASIIQKGFKDKKYFRINKKEPLVKSSEDIVRNASEILKGKNYKQTVSSQYEVIKCQEPRQRTEALCIEDRVTQRVEEDAIHRMVAHIIGFEDWSYGVLFNVFTRTHAGHQARTDAGWKKNHYGVIEGEPFPMPFIPRIKEIKYPARQEIRTTLNGQVDSRGPRSFNFNPSTGDLWIETSYGWRYGSWVRFDAYIPLEIKYRSNPKRQAGGARGCEALREKERQGICREVSYQPMEGPEQRSIEGETVFADWWKRRVTFSCGIDRPNTCIPVRERGCIQVASSCKEYLGEECVLWEQTFHCSLGEGPVTITETGQGILIPDAQLAYAPNTEMNDAIAKLQILKEAQEEIRQAQGQIPSIFKGNSGRCTIAFGGFKDCCKKEGGWGVDLHLTDCDAEDRDLAAKRQKELCVEIGTFCAERLPPPIKTCLRKKKTYCCFPSRLSRVLQEQGRRQLGMGWGSAKSPDCRGFTIEELSRINFDQLDLREIFQAVYSRMKQIDPATLQRSISSRIETISEPFKKGEKNL